MPGRSRRAVRDDDDAATPAPSAGRDREWFADRVRADDLAEYLNRLEAEHRKIVAFLNTFGVRGATAILVVSVKQKGA